MTGNVQITKDGGMSMLVLEISTAIVMTIGYSESFRFCNSLSFHFKHSGMSFRIKGSKKAIDFIEKKSKQIKKDENS